MVPPFSMSPFQTNSQETPPWLLPTVMDALSYTDWLVQSRAKVISPMLLAGVGTNVTTTIVL